MSTRFIKVLIVDDDPIVRMSLTTILSAQSDFEVCGDGGSNGQEAIILFQDLAPDVLLMDIQMPEMTGLEAARMILASQPEARIVFLTTFSDDEYIVAALRMGAKGYLIKEDVANITPAIRSVMAGQMVLGREVLSKVDVLFAERSSADSSASLHLGAAPAASSAMPPKDSAASARPPQASAPCSFYRAQAASDGLTERESEIIELIAQGLDNKEISANIFISEGTVRNHVSTILQKLHLKNRTQLAIYYYRSQEA